MFKWSYYNIEISKNPDGSLLLYNTLSSSLGVLNKEIVESMYSKKVIDENLLNVEEIEHFKTIKQNGFLVNEVENEKVNIQYLHRANRFNTMNLSLVIAPTLDCNMRCKYCYEDKKNEKMYMSSETEENIVKFAQNYINRNRPTNFHVTWYGGEPLLAMDTIINLSKKFIDISNENNLTYSAGLITNGIYLNDENQLRLLENSQINFVQVTIDGTEEVHNKRRYLKNGTDNFHTIINNIRSAMNHFRVSIRVNIDSENSDNITSLIDYFEQDCCFNENVDYYFAPVEKTTDACKIDVTRCFNQEEFSKINHDLKKKMVKEYNHSPNLVFRPPSYSSNCGATHVGNYIIDPNGNLYNCWSVVGVPKFMVGNVIEGITNNALYVKWIMYEHNNRCKECNLLPLCNTGCPHRNIFGNNNECESQVYNYVEELKVIYDYFTNSKIDSNERR